jgi:hypothetical protein
VDDLLVGAPDTNQSGLGWAYLITGGTLPATPLDLGQADAVLSGAAAGDYAGYSVDGAGDVNGDGFDDVIVGAFWADVSGFNDGKAYLVHGPITSMSLAGAAATFEGEAHQDNAGNAVSGAGDVNGDGFDDLLIGAPDHDIAGLSDGIAYLVYGPVTGTHRLSSADARFLGERSGANTGTSLDSAGDVNGDGFDDVLIGGTSDAYLLYGPLSGDIDLANADVRFRGPYGIGTAVHGAGDLNNDGFDDVVLGSPNDDGYLSDAGAVYVFFGPIASGELDVALADAVIYGRSPTDVAGTSVTSVGDMNNDGFGDLLIGARLSDTGADDAGAAYLVYGPFSGEHSLDDAQAQLVSTVRDADAGMSVAAGDLDGDGVPDLVVGAPGDTTNGGDAGAAFVVPGAELPAL